MIPCLEAGEEWLKEKEEEDEIGKIQSSGIGEGTNTLTMREIEKVGDT